MINNNYNNEDALDGVIPYVIHSQNNIHNLAFGFGCNIKNCIEQFKIIKQVYGKCEGRQLRHFIVSFAKSENIDSQDAFYIGYEVCQYYSDRYQIIYGLHENTDDLHIHFVMNTVSYVDGKMYREGYSDFNTLKALVDNIVAKYNNPF